MPIFLCLALSMVRLTDDFELRLTFARAEDGYGGTKLQTSRAAHLDGPCAASRNSERHNVRSWTSAAQLRKSWNVMHGRGLAFASGGRDWTKQADALRDIRLSNFV
jgi:hypothetical protein